MKRPALYSCVSAAAITVAMSSLAFSSSAYAADQAPAAAAAAATPASDTLAEIVVTASTSGRSKLDTSVSISSISADVISDFHPMSEGDALRLLPGIQPNVSGPGGNGNFAVRGLPVTTGGSPFVQLQEDGLPQVLYGDMQFGNNDYFTKSSPTDERLEDIRGGNAATLASQAPGAVINYISKTSRSEGGYVELEKGLDYDYTKLKFLDSGIINDSTYYNIGGFYDVGHGPQHAAYNVSNSYLIKGNVTHEFDEGKGFIRLLFKVADTQEPNATGGEECGTLVNNVVSNLHACPGFDARTTSNYSLYNANVHYVDYNTGGLAQTPLNGISTLQKTMQVQLHYKLDNGITLDDNARYSAISGGFASNFVNFAPTAGLIGSTVNGQQVASAVYASGPNAGQAVSEPFYNNNVEIYTHLRNVGSFVNDTKLNWKGDLGGGLRANLTAGWFYMSQNIAMDWHPGQYNAEASNNPSGIDLLNAAGNLLTVNGAYGYNNNWGAGVARTYDYTFTDNAPFADLILDVSGFELDASVRHDINHGSGTGTSSSGVAHSITQQAVNPVTGLTQSVTLPYYLTDGPTEVLNYTTPTTSWSVGTSYKATESLNLFLRASKGVRFNSDRLTFNGYFNADGSLDTKGQVAATDLVYQYEIGLKNRGTLGPIHYTTELTGFYSHFNITTYQLSQTICPIITGNATTYTCIEANKYKTTGLESYSTFRVGGLNVITNLTYNHSQEAPSGTATPVYAKSQNIPNLVYSVAASYNFTDKASAGLIWAGTSSLLTGANIQYPGSSVVSANLKYSPVKNLQFGVNVYNLFNSFATLGGGGGGEIITSGTSFVGSTAPANGRIFTGSVKVSF